MKRQKRKGMNLSMAQVRFAYAKLMGRKINGDERFQNEANEMFVQHGEEAILDALKDYDREAYVTGKYDI